MDLETAAKVGGWVFAGFLLGAVVLVLLNAMKRGELVPGELLKASMASNDKLAESQGKLTTAVENFGKESTAALRELNTAIRELRDDVAELRNVQPPRPRR